MTCTHAALKRAELVELGFAYDSVLMEEAAQVLEVETFIPLVLQANSARLKRVVLIGDHNQLPPIIRNAAFQRYSSHAFLRNGCSINTLTIFLLSASDLSFLLDTRTWINRYSLAL